MEPYIQGISQSLLYRSANFPKGLPLTRNPVKLTMRISCHTGQLNSAEQRFSH